jgi:ABC-type sulfate/molybdate transport systems ATPase subunit
MANSPLLLLLDEPTSALDEASKIEVEMTLLKVVRERALACILVTHDTSQALRLAQRALMLATGKVVRVGVASEVLHA